MSSPFGPRTLLEPLDLAHFYDPTQKWLDQGETQFPGVVFDGDLEYHDHYAHDCFGPK